MKPVDVLTVLGAALIVGGTAAISIPAGIITLGVFLIAAGVALAWESTS